MPDPLCFRGHTLPLQQQAAQRLQQKQRGGSGDAPTLAPLDDVVDLNDQDALGMAPLHLAAMGGHGAVVKCLLLNGASQDDSAPSRHAPPLHSVQPVIVADC